MRPDLTPEKQFDLNQELNQIYDELATVAVRQQALNKTREALEADRNAVLIELGRRGVMGWDVS